MDLSEQGHSWQRSAQEQCCTEGLGRKNSEGDQPCPLWPAGLDNLPGLSWLATVLQQRETPGFANVTGCTQRLHGRNAATEKVQGMEHELVC